MRGILVALAFAVTIAVLVAPFVFALVEFGAGVLRYGAMVNP